MPVPIVNVVVVLLRQSITPINMFLTKTFMSGPATQYERNIGFRFFRQFGQTADKTERYCKDAAMKTSELAQKVKGGQGQASGSASRKAQVQLSPEQHFKMGVTWWSELFIFYGILTAIACWEIRKFHQMSLNKKQRINDIETK